MKTTIDIADALLAEAKKAARDADVTLREIVECGIRKELLDRAKPREKFVWKDLSYGDRSAATWLKPPFKEEDWSAIREASYERDDGD